MYLTNLINRVLISIFLALCIISCGSSSDFAFVFVSDFSVEPGSATVGDQASVLVVFKSSRNGIFDDSISVDDTDVAVLLPAGVEYVDRSSEIDNGGITGFDKRPPNSVTLCDDGSRALLFRFSGDEISPFNDNRLRLKVIPFEKRGTVTLLAEADNRILTPCGIIGQSSDKLTIN